MKKNYKTIRFMLSALMIAALCACTNDGMESENQNKISKPTAKRLTQVCLDYGQLHNDLLDSCLLSCNQVQIEPYLVSSTNDEGFYSLYAQYMENIIGIVGNYHESMGGDMSILPSPEDISTPQEFLEYKHSLIEQITGNFPAGEYALEQVDDLFGYYLNHINGEVPLISDPYWIELSGHIEDFADDIYLHSLDLCTTDEEREGLEVMLGVMVGSFNYWSSPEKMEMWRELAWNANCQYLNLPEGNPEISQAESWQTVLREVIDFVTTDATGAEIGWWLGTVVCPGVGSTGGAVMIGAITSGAIALTWE